MTNFVILAVISALVEVESGGDPSAFNKRSGAAGLLQIKPVAVAEANRLAARSARPGVGPWTSDDRYDELKSLQMAYTTLEFHYRRGCVDPVDLGCRWYYPYAPGRVPAKYRAAVAASLKVGIKHQEPRTKNSIETTWQFK